VDAQETAFTARLVAGTEAMVQCAPAEVVVAASVCPGTADPKATQSVELAQVTSVTPGKGTLPVR
jgi:hypothetical protein